MAHAGHTGLNTPDGQRNDLSRQIPHPDYYHFGTDIAGTRLITDTGPRDDGGAIYLGALAADETAPLAGITYVLNPGSSWESHIHPFLSPDGRTGFFNSDKSGLL